MKFKVTNQLLDRVKAKYELTTEYQLAVKLGVPHSSLHRWRKGETSMKWETALRIADILEIDDRDVVYSLIDEKFTNPRLIAALKGMAAGDK